MQINQFTVLWHFSIVYRIYWEPLLVIVFILVTIIASIFNIFENSPLLSRFTKYQHLIVEKQPKLDHFQVWFNINTISNSCTLINQWHFSIVHCIFSKAAISYCFHSCFHEPPWLLQFSSFLKTYLQLPILQSTNTS